MTGLALVQLLVALVDGVSQGLPEAIAAYDRIKAMVAEGRDPTAAEWAALDADADALFARAQAAGPAASAP